MRIFSKFHDYYDGVQGLGFDASIIYNREKKEIKKNEAPAKYRKIYDDLPYLTIDYTPRLESLFIGFCGKIYPCLKVSKQGKDIKFCYSFESVKSHLLTLKATEKDLGIYRFKNIERFFKKAESVEYKEDLHPIIVFDKTYHYGSPLIVMDAKLKDYQFEKLVDPYQAFQQIEMFLSNIAVPIKPIPKMSDQEKRDSHGFDNWSFKKK